MFFPAVANYAGWSDPKGTSASFDYAGLADAALGGRLGTSIDGSIDETLQADGSVLVKVVLHTHNALAFGVQGFDFNGPLLFGHRVAEILAGAPAVLHDPAMLRRGAGFRFCAVIRGLCQSISGQVGLELF